jgi:hypothetical protein
MNNLKTKLFLEGLAAMKRFAESIPQKRSVSVMEVIGRGKKKGTFYGHPVAEIGLIPDDEPKKIQVKVLRSNSREATKWLKKRANKSLNGNRGAVCEFDLVKRVRGSKGKAVGVIRRCYVDTSGVDVGPVQMPDREWAD